RAELDVEIELLDSHALVDVAFDINLDSPGFGVIKGAMTEVVQIERAIQLAIDSREHVEIESRCHAQCIVVSRFQNRWIFFEIRAEQKRVAFIEHASRRTQETQRFVEIEVADV